MKQPLFTLVLLLLGFSPVRANDEPAAAPLFGYTEFQTNLKGGRHPNVRTMRATIVQQDGSGNRRIAEAAAARASLPAKPRRVLYNFDGDSCLTTKAGGKGPVPVQIDDVKRLIDEVAYEGSRVDSVLVCVNAQVMYYPTKIGTLRGTHSTPEERANWPASEKQRFENLKAFFDAGVDPYAVMLAETRRRGREALLTFRMNDDHGNDFLRTQFLADHPDWRLGTEQYHGKGALDFARDEVRDYTFRLIDEAVRRYDCDGLELDFNRFPTFFKTGTTDERVAKMNSLVKRIRKMLDDVGRERGSPPAARRPRPFELRPHTADPGNRPRNRLRRSGLGEKWLGRFRHRLRIPPRTRRSAH